MISSALFVSAELACKICGVSAKRCGVNGYMLCEISTHA